jgi:hypothetical protein
MNVIQFMQGLLPWKKDVGKGDNKKAEEIRKEEAKLAKTRPT